MTNKEPGLSVNDQPEKVIIPEILSYIVATERNSSLFEEKNFDSRLEAIDFIGFHLIDQIEALLPKTAQPDQLTALGNRAEKVKAALEQIDINLFQRLRASIRAKEYTAKEFSALISEYVNFNLDDEHQEEPGYDNLDNFINGLSSFHPMPEQIKDLEPDMVYYQKTPARVIFDLVEKSHFSQDDVFFDLGSGLGQAAILVNLLAGIKVKGVEFDPAFCDYARDCAAGLNLSDVTFINCDARKVDYSEGTTFFMYTPFTGEIMREVLTILRKESFQKEIKIITYGPCTEQLFLQDWLSCTTAKDDSIYKLAFFTSL